MVALTERDTVSYILIDAESTSAPSTFCLPSSCYLSLHPCPWIYCIDCFAAVLSADCLPDLSCSFGHTKQVTIIKIQA
jgi:hypothetical protein